MNVPRSRTPMLTFLLGVVVILGGWSAIRKVALQNWSLPKPSRFGKAETRDVSAEKLSICAVPVQNVFGKRALDNPTPFECAENPS